MTVDNALMLRIGCPCWFCSMRRGRYTLLDMGLMIDEIRRGRA